MESCQILWHCEPSAYCCDMLSLTNCEVLISMSCYCCSVAQFCLTLCNPMDCSTPGFSVHRHLLLKLMSIALEKEMATRSSILAWKTPWTEEPGGLKSTSHEESGMTEHARACICTHDSLIHFTVQQNLILHCDAITPLPQRETASKAMFPKVSGSENLS